ncbi:hypothetical protein ACPFL9_20435 [Paenarthrobacter sp. NyZ202]|uniref:hypothetical protein n=1 Tax=Paenarthrobacter sp. NyZ202 TaxID=3402689 RepID=UPI003CEEEDBA
MGLRSLFRRKRAAAAPARTAPVTPTPEEPLSPEALEEIEAAWADLEEAAKESGVKGIHACSRGGQPWQKDPAAVRTIAAAIRALPEAAEERAESS